MEKVEIEATQSPKKAHALILPFPYQGHINPMLEFSKRLATKGVKITLANTKFINKSMHEVLHNNDQFDIETISDGFDDGHTNDDVDYLSVFKKVGSETLLNLINKINGPDNDCQPINVVIYDAFLPWALDVARQFGLITAVFFTQTCAVNSVYYHVQRDLLPVPLTGPVSLPGLPLLQISDTSSYVAYFGSYPHFYNMVMDQFTNIDDAGWVLSNTFYELEKEVVDWMAKKWRMRTIGPTLPSMYLDKRLKEDKDYSINVYKPNKSECMSWLQDKPSGSVVYVSFGSFADLEKDNFEEIAWGLKGTNCYFLWVVREPEQHKLPNNFVEETMGKGLIVTWSPQLEVLSHDSIGCFVTHCGLNSVMEGLCLGVPMVAMPLWTDQPTNAKYVEDVWKVGVRVVKDGNGIVRREIVEKCITDLMVDGDKRTEILENAKKWKNLAIGAVDEGGSSDTNIKEFVADLISS